jgi:hypothetical protein
MNLCKDGHIPELDDEDLVQYFRNRLLGECQLTIELRQENQKDDNGHS